MFKHQTKTGGRSRRFRFCENWRPWEKLWDQTAVALEFFHRNLPFDKMVSADGLVEKGKAWCFAREGEVYAVYVFAGEKVEVRLLEGNYKMGWFDIRKGGDLHGAEWVKGPGLVPLGTPSQDMEKDWVVVIRREL